MIHESEVDVAVIAELRRLRISTEIRESFDEEGLPASRLPCDGDVPHWVLEMKLGLVGVEYAPVYHLEGSNAHGQGGRAGMLLVGARDGAPDGTPDGTPARGEAGGQRCGRDEQEARQYETGGPERGHGGIDRHG